MKAQINKPSFVRFLVWLGLFIIAFASLAMVAIPVFLIKPFSPQTEQDLAVSFALKNWSPIVTIVLAIWAIGVAGWLWRKSRWFGKASLIIPLALVAVSIWFARQNHFEWMFNPLANSSYVKASEANFVNDNEMVLAVEINGEVVAYPVLQMAYHHIAQDVVGGTPITATY